MKKIRRAFELFLAVLRGEEFVRRSSRADEEIMGWQHPDRPGYVTRTESYYGSSSLGTGAKI